MNGGSSHFWPSKFQLHILVSFLSNVKLEKSEAFIIKFELLYVQNRFGLNFAVYFQRVFSSLQMTRLIVAIIRNK